MTAPLGDLGLELRFDPGQVRLQLILETRFLEIPGAPLDNNLVERALKRAILHRKGALFYKTLHGAHVGDLFMSVVHTCELNGVNAFAYLIELQRHADTLKETPGAWLPWTYRATR